MPVRCPGPLGLLLYFFQGLGEMLTPGLTQFACRFSGSYRRIASRGRRFKLYTDRDVIPAM